ncbi:MAG: serine/threonine protein kinase [Planctomycetes bacterium]|nr:serine/threonine protein kinase [Planctomycetota bacterium]
MSELPEHDEHPGDAADLRLAEVLSGSSSGADLRRELEGEETAEANDLLARLNALEFVDQVVGGTGELPKRIGGYEIKGVLGRGGMGTVFLGWQQELEREVALKVLAQGFASDPTMRKRFRAEARATAALHHRHIVPIYDYGEAQGMSFFAMERVDGMSLDKHIAAARRGGQRPLELLDAARRFAGVADALGLAHRRRLLHRDVKPGNILVAVDGTLALTDFGLAKALDHASMHLTSKGGGFLGTLHYASPEQALGAELTPASDLYSLGVTIFEAVTGELPIAGKTTEALLQSILHGTPKRLRDLLPKPPRDFEAVLDKLLQREPGDRYQDGEALSRDLLRLADGEPVHIRRLPLHVRLWRRARKNPVLTGALLAVVVLVLSTVVLLSVLRREKGQGLISRHQNSLVEIRRDVGSERGAVAGPAPLLQALTGLALGDAAPSPAVLEALRQAELRMPDDPQAAAMRSAYADDPMPRASALLREGRGFEAMSLFDREIADLEPERSGGNLATELGLYRLYLGRAVARLTTAVAQPDDARTDLALASYLRPGAVFPRTLVDVLDVVQGADGDLARLERELQSAAPERRRTLGVLLSVAAGLQRPAAANLMEFELTYRRRRALHDAGQRLLGEALADCVDGTRPTGIAAVFSQACRRALDRLGDPAELRDLAEQSGKAIAATAHDGSPLQGWRHLLQLLLLPRQHGPLLDAAQEPLPPGMQLTAWRCLLQLEPRRELVQLWLPRFEELLHSHPGIDGMTSVAATMYLLAGHPEARAWADRWIVEADGDPAAQLCRMRARLQEGDIEQARDDAMVAVQESLVPEATLAEVARLSLDAARELEAGASEGARLMSQQFRMLLDGVVHAGGPR